MGVGTLTLRAGDFFDRPETATTVQLSATGSAGSLSGPAPLVEGELPPGTYTLAPAERTIVDGSTVYDKFWTCEGDIESVSVVTIVVGAHVECVYETAFVDSPQQPPTTIAPATSTTLREPTTDTFDRDSPAEDRDLSTFIKEEFLGATAEITFNDTAPDENGRVVGLIEGQEADLVVELIPVADTNKPEDLPEGVTEASVALIGRTNRVWVTCPEEIREAEPKPCERFRVEQPNPLQQDFADLTFEFKFEPLVPGEMIVVVVVDGVLEFVGDGVDEANPKQLRKEFELDIVVSDQRESWEQLAADAGSAVESLLSTEVPPATKGDPVVVTSTFTYPDGLLEGVQVDLFMTSDARLSIQPAPPIQSGQTVTRSWTVTPLETGPLGLDFWLTAKSSFGEEESAKQKVFLQVSDAAGPTFETVTDAADGVFSTVVYVAGGLAVIVGLLTALGAKTWWQKRKMTAAAPAGSGTSEPPTA